MNQLSDLELVAQAMSSSESGSQSQSQSQSQTTTRRRHETEARAGIGAGIGEGDQAEAELANGNEKGNGIGKIDGGEKTQSTNGALPDQILHSSTAAQEGATISQPSARAPQRSSGNINSTPNTNTNTNTELSSLGLDLDSTTLASLTSLMSLSEEDMDGLDENGIMDLLAQFEAADGVADDLEGKLDKLLEKLGGVEEEIVQDQAQSQGRGQ
ncbi:hypothetical protein IAU59_005728 [Kwoniella sp. CBS 9459]